MDLVGHWNCNKIVRTNRKFGACFTTTLHGLRRRTNRVCAQPGISSSLALTSARCVRCLYARPDTVESGDIKRGVNDEPLGTLYKPSRRPSDTNVGFCLRYNEGTPLTCTFVSSSRLLSFPDNRTILTALIFIMNCIRNSKRRMCVIHYF